MGDWVVGYSATKQLIDQNLFDDEHRERILKNYEGYHNWMVKNGQMPTQNQVHLQESDEQKEKRSQLRKNRQEQVKKEKARKKRRLNKRSRSA